MSYFVNNSNRALRKTFILENKEVRLIVDSGASCCLLNQNCISKKIKDQINGSQVIDVHGVNGITHTLGTVDTFIKYEGYSYPITFHVVKELPESVTGLIGTNFLKRFGATIDFANGQVSLRAPKFHENYSVPARTEMVTYVETTFTEDVVVLKQEIQPHVFIANTLVTPVDGKIPVQLINVKNKDVKIENFKPVVVPARNYVTINNFSEVGSKKERLNKLLQELSFVDIPKKEAEDILQICVKYSDIFALKGDKLTFTEIYTPEIKIIKGTQPVYCKPYRLPHAQHTEVEFQTKKNDGRQNN